MARPFSVDIGLYIGYCIVRHLYTILTYPRWSQPSRFLPIWRLGTIKERPSETRLASKADSTMEVAMPLTFPGNPPFHTTLAREPLADAEGANIVLTVPLYVDEQWPHGAEVLLNLSIEESHTMENRLRLAREKALRNLKNQP
jgi:hypothetical protein